MEQATSENNGYMNIKKGQVIEFGSYDGDKDKFNRKEPIEWIVLDVDDKEGVALLLSKYCLERLSYLEECTDVTWETCTLRKWLNDEFYDEAFSLSEKQRILLTTIKNPDNPEGTPGGNDTKDRVFLLSYEDMINNGYGFSEDPVEKDINRRSALAEDKERSPLKDGETVDGEFSSWWWLRFPGPYRKGACVVNDNGTVDSHVVCDGTNFSIPCVRPALYINLNS